LTLIPRRFIRVWPGQDPIPPKFEGFWLRFQELHPEWEFVTLTDLDAEALLAPFPSVRAIYRDARSYAERSDTMRIAAVHTLGGVYVDTDIEPLRPWDALMDDPAPFIGWQSTRTLCQAVLGGPAGHPATLALLDGLAAWYWDRRDHEASVSTGPKYVTKMWRHRDDVRKLPIDTFYPVYFRDKTGQRRRMTDRLDGNYPPTSLAVHHCVQGWTKKAAMARVAAEKRANASWETGVE
jgi:mannosyltransferase OCH1-like enzyme